MSSKKVLILYYSGSGNTKKMAKAIAGPRVLNVSGEEVGKLLTSPDYYGRNFN